MQKLDFNKDGKLVPYTDHGWTDGKSATTEIKGTFEVSADVVNFILAKEYDLPATIHIELEKEELDGHYSYNHLFCCIGNDEQQRVLQEYKHRLQEYKQQLDEYSQRLYEANNKLQRLRKAVNDFNNFRWFYKRKIKIENV